MDWELKQELKKQLQEEQGYYVYPVGTRTRFALVYPNSYFVGMSNLGFHIIYDLLNKRSDTACERVFLPERTKVQVSVAWRRAEHVWSQVLAFYEALVAHVGLLSSDGVGMG